ncbi:uncharacterized protein LOC142327357 [Lycorma delicatula]|uniref:uncharacterized protein LOC142327357 n=1 Tax=Lycorma delicatula TaxID=130591 RepID=UPI003F50DC91
MHNSAEIRFSICFIILFINFICIQCYTTEPKLMINKAGTDNYNKSIINQVEHISKTSVQQMQFSIFQLPNRTEGNFPRPDPTCPNGGRWIMGQCRSRWRLLPTEGNTKFHV